MVIYDFLKLTNNLKLSKRYFKLIIFAFLTFDIKINTMNIFMKK